MLNDLIKFIQFLVSLGLGPIDIVLVVVAVALYIKAEALDAQLHACLAKVIAKVAEKDAGELAQKRIDDMK